MAEANVCYRKPTSAFSLYIKLYCMKRKGKLKYHSSIITEATKSWLTLSNEEKEIFNSKYNGYCENVRKSYANKLKNIEPFLKQKKERNFQDTVMNSSRPKELQTTASTIHTSFLGPQDDFGSNTGQMKYDYEHQESQNHLEDSQKDVYEDPNLHLMDIPQKRLPEPIVPTIRTAKDLFDVVSTLNEGIDSNWRALSLLQKRRYQSAASALKKDYIIKYKNYLDSLPSEELFEHHCSKISEGT